MQQTAIENRQPVNKIDLRRRAQDAPASEVAMSANRIGGALMLIALTACNAAQSDEQYYAYRCSAVRGIEQGSPGYDTCIAEERYWLDYNRHMHGGVGP